ncbi:hypothetical protein SAMN05216191_101543 [Paenibacillus jilunlii]|uniref:Uncharacterized protein n=1 Tax=Paenibacillus jilunlii TaxID=682956 RepID=A0A1G9GSG4_9BACL|nr:hypothetical protein SAMN05216191_101543 [Paenibacillus jilunlii]
MSIFMTNSFNLLQTTNKLKLLPLFDMMNEGIIKCSGKCSGKCTGN